MKHPGIYSKLCYIHMAIYVIYFAALEILPVRNFLNQHLGVLYTLIGVSGAFLLVLDFFSRRIMFQIQHARILMLFFVATIASICINYQYDLAGNMKCIMWMAVQVFLFGAIDKKESGTVHVKRLCMLFDIFILIWLIGVLWALWQYIVQFGGYFETLRMDRIQMLHIGFIDQRLFGMFQDANYASICSSFAIGFAEFCRRWGKRPRVFHIYYIITIILQICYIILSGSRMGLLAAFITMFFCSSCLAGAKIRQNAGIKVTAGILLGVLSTGLLFGGYKAIQTGLSYLPPFVKGICEELYEPKTETEPIHQNLPKNTPKPAKQPEKTEGAGSERVSFVREDVVNKRDFSNNRFAIWSDYLAILKTTPIFGASPRGYTLYAKAHFDDLYILRRQYVNVHNGYLLALVGAGILGGGLMLMWTVRVGVMILGYLVRRRRSGDRYYGMIFLLTLLLLMTAVSILTVQGIFFCNIIPDVLFWIVLGYTLYFIRISEYENNRKRLSEQSGGMYGK